MSTDSSVFAFGGSDFRAVHPTILAPPTGTCTLPVGVRLPLPTPQKRHTYFACFLLLQEILLDDQILKLGVNIGGDVLKLAADYGVQVRLPGPMKHRCGPAVSIWADTTQCCSAAKVYIEQKGRRAHFICLWWVCVWSSNMAWRHLTCAHLPCH
jgi:hypothetical protein